MNPELTMPQDLTAVGRMAWRIIYDLLHKHELTFTGGCTVFRSPRYWEARKEEYFTRENSELILVYDGAAVKEMCGLGSEQYALNNEFQKALENVGLFYEEGTHWFGAVRKRHTFQAEMRQIRGMIQYADREDLVEIVTSIADGMYADESEIEKDGKSRGVLYNAGKNVSGGDLIEIAANALTRAGFEPDFNQDFDDEEEQ